MLIMCFSCRFIYKQIYICFIKGLLHESGNELHNSHVVEINPPQILKCPERALEQSLKNLIRIL